VSLPATVAGAVGTLGRRCARACRMLLVVALACAGTGAAQAQLMRGAGEGCHPVTLRAPSAPEPTARQVCIPPDYVRHAVRGTTRADLALTARWPTMEGAFGPGWRERPHDQETWGGLLIILFGPVGSYPDIRARFEATKRLNHLTVPAEPAHGLVRLAADTDALTPGERAWRIHEVYFGGEGEDFIYIRCALPQPASFAGCDAEFTQDGYLVKVSFSRVFLPQWDAIRDATGRLVSGFGR